MIDMPAPSADGSGTDTNAEFKSRPRYHRKTLVLQGFSAFLDVTDLTVTILECRPPWRRTLGRSGPGSRWPGFGTPRREGEWTLCWRDRNLKFHEYDLAPPTPHVEDLIAEIARDPTCIFWG